MGLAHEPAYFRILCRRGTYRVSLFAHDVGGLSSRFSRRCSLRCLNSSIGGAPSGKVLTVEDGRADDDSSTRGVTGSAFTVGSEDPACSWALSGCVGERLVKDTVDTGSTGDVDGIASVDASSINWFSSLRISSS
mmetsp:Transcript_6465/g.12948  ORF Transcript_6465/g.12948 Transcript_6465/m.12948 type:complete len:135 (-) Transcript_6465:2027-2431(-)